MDHIAEITTPDNIVLVRFDPEKKAECVQAEAIIGEMADEGLVYGLEFHTEQ